MATPHDESGLDRIFVRRTLFVFGVAAALFLLWQLSGALLLAFAAVILAVILRSVAEPIAAHTRIGEAAAVAIAGLLLLATLAGAGWLFGFAVAGQMDQLIANLPRSAADLQALVADWPFGAQLARMLAGGPELLAGAQGVVGRVGGYALTLAGVVTSVVLVIIAGVFLAISPRYYRDGVILLFPEPRRPALREAADSAGRALRAWVLGQLADMVVVGVMTGVGVSLIGLTSPLALGVLAGLLAFVPIVGSIAGAVPGVLLAVQGGWELVAWTVLVYVVVQQVEGNLIYPFIQKRAVNLPPALTIFGVVVFGMLFGIMGVLVATPMMVVLFVGVRLLYLRRTLHEDVSAPGEPSGSG